MTWWNLLYVLPNQNIVKNIFFQMLDSKMKQM